MKAKVDQRWIARKELAWLCGVSYRVIMNNEKHLGLDRVKVRLRGCILYHREPALQAVMHMVRSN